jgi:hypothetical protein
MFTSFQSCGNQSEKDRAVTEYAKKNGFSIKSNNVENADPAILFCYSNHLWTDGQKNEDIFLYYVAQYRYRILSTCSENLKAGSFSEEAAKNVLLKTGVVQKEADLANLHLIGGVYRIDLYETIQQKLGVTINGYAYGDLEQMKSIIDEVLKYEENYPFNPMGLRPQPLLKNENIQAEKLVIVKESYVSQKKQIIEEADYLRAERSKNGLENR